MTSTTPLADRRSLLKAFQTTLSAFGNRPVLRGLFHTGLFTVALFLLASTGATYAASRVLGAFVILPAPLFPSSWLPAGVLLGAVLALVLYQRPALRPLAALVAAGEAFLLASHLLPLASPFHVHLWTLELLRAAHPFTAPRPTIYALSLASFFPPFLLLALRFRNLSLFRSARKSAHGSSRYATGADLPDAPLGSGISLGSLGRRPIVDPGDHHVLAIAPSGAGKTAGPVIKTLLSNLCTAVVTDPKGELYHRTAGWRAANGHTVFRLAPFDPDLSTHQWNPLGALRAHPQPVLLARKLAEALLPPEPQGATHWTAKAINLLAAAIAHSAHDPQLSTLADLHRFLAGEFHPNGHEGLLEHLQTTSQLQEVVTTATSLLSTPPRERGSIFSTALRALEPLNNPEMRRVTRTTTIPLDQVISPLAPPATLYLELPYGNQQTVAPLLRALLVVLLDTVVLLRTAETSKSRPVLFILDEAASLGHVPSLPDYLAYLRGYGLRILLIFQDLRQVRHLYGHNESVTSNCRAVLGWATTDRETREHLSSLSGDTTLDVAQVSRSRSFGTIFGTRTRHHQLLRRPLLTPEEVGRIPADKLLAFLPFCPPAVLDQAPYYRNPQYLRRASMQPPQIPPLAPSVA